MTSEVQVGEGKVGYALSIRRLQCDVDYLINRQNKEENVLPRLSPGLQD